MSAVFIIILGGIFLVAAVTAIYVLVEKKVISNPLDYISSIFSPGGTGGTGGTVGTLGTEETEETEETEDYDDDSSSYVDRFSPNKTVKGRYVWITRENPNSIAYRNAMHGEYGKYPVDARWQSVPIVTSEIMIIGKGGEILTEKKMDSDGKQQAPEVDVFDDSGPVPEVCHNQYATRCSDLLFNNDIDSETYEYNTKKFMTGNTSNKVDYIKIDLRRIKTITGIRIDSIYENFLDDRYNHMLYGVYVVITKQDSLDRPVAITPVINSIGTSHSFTFPGTQWDSDTHEDLELKFL
jgi:hypothetical protein